MSFQTRKTFVHLQNTNEDILMKSESFLTLHRQQHNWHVQGPERYIFKIVHVTWLNCNFLKLREYFLCAKKTKITSWYFRECALNYDMEEKKLFNRCFCGSVVEHCVSRANGCGFISQGTHILIKRYIAWMHCKSLWIKASAKCININVIKSFFCFLCAQKVFS